MNNTISDDRAMLVLDVDEETLDSLADELGVDDDAWTAGDLADAVDLLADDE